MTRRPTFEPRTRTLKSTALLSVSLAIGLSVTACGRDSGDSVDRTQGDGPSRTLEIPAEVVSDVVVPVPQGAVSLGHWMLLGDGRVVGAQTEPGRVYLGAVKGNSVNWIEEIARTAVVGELAWDEALGLMVLDDLQRRFHRLTLGGRQSLSLPATRFERDLCISPTGTVVATSLSDALLIHFDQHGAVINTLGERLPYENRDLDFALNAGSVACWNDVVYIGLVHPAVVRAYRLDGSLLWETSLHLRHALPDPAASRSSPTGGLVSVTSSYSIATLDVDTDTRGNVYVLKSGLERRAALTGGSDRIDVIDRNGTHLAELVMPFRSRRIQVTEGALYAISHSPMTVRRIDLTKVSIPGA